MTKSSRKGFEVDPDKLHYQLVYVGELRVDLEKAAEKLNVLKGDGLMSQEDLKTCKDLLRSTLSILGKYLI